MTGIAVRGLDHLVLTVRDVDASCAFYESVLGMRRETFGEGRVALHFGSQKINLHPHPSPIEPKATQPAPGSADLCLVVEGPIDAVAEHVRAHGVDIELGPVPRTGAVGSMTSVYLRDPDGNLVELAVYDA